MNFDVSTIWKKYDDWQNSAKYKMYQAQKIPNETRMEMYKDRVLKIGDRVKYPDWDPSPESLDLVFTIEQVFGDGIYIVSDKNALGGSVGIFVNAYSVDLVK